MATGVTSKSKQVVTPFELTYEGKRSVEDVISAKYGDYKIVLGEGAKQFYFGDNLDVLLFLLNNGLKGKVELIYIDPPFSTAFDFLSRDQVKAYDDSLRGAAFIEFLRERLLVMKELLSPTGSIYLHLDGNMAFAIKLIMDEVFGPQNCRAFITRKKCSTKNSSTRSFGNISDYLMFYTKGSRYTWHRPYMPWSDEKILEQYPYIDEVTGRRYKKVPVHAPGIRKGETGKEWRGMLPPPGKHWQYTPKKLDELDAAGEIYWSKTGNPRRKVFLDAKKGIPRQDIWMDYRDSINQTQQTTGYPTEKNIEMLKMIVAASSNPGDLILDCFSGSGTTLHAAEDLGRKWIGVDNSVESLKAIRKRFVTGMEVYGDYVKVKRSKQMLFDLSSHKPLSFSIFSTDACESVVRSVFSGDDEVS